MHTYTERTQDVQIDVVPLYLEAQSNSQHFQHVFVYKVAITNHGFEPVQLLSRHWVITDGHGRVEEVRGAGVVGLQPIIQPKETFRYESFCPLITPTGNMRGTYQMTTTSGQTFDVRIPLFFLRSDVALH